MTMILSALYCRQGVAGAEEALAGRAVDPDAGAKEGGGGDEGGGRA